MKRALLVLTGLFLAAPVAAQAPSPAQMGVVPTLNPEPLQVLDSAKIWSTIGTVNPATHVFTPVGGGGGGGSGNEIDLSVLDPTIGMVDDGVTDNSSMVPALMHAISATPPGNTSLDGAQRVVFPAIPGQARTFYRFSKNFVLSRNAEYHCNGGGGGTGGVYLIFDPGVKGVIQEDRSLTDGGAGGGSVTNCNVTSQGLALGLTTKNSSTLTGMSFINYLPTAPVWHNGDGIIVAAQGANFGPWQAALTVPPGAYLDPTAGVSGTTLTLAPGFKTSPITEDYASAVFTQIAGTSNNFINNDTIQAGANTFTAQTSVSATPCTFQIGANWDASVANLVALVNTNASAAGQTVACTTPTTDVTAMAWSTPYNPASKTVAFSAVAVGTVGNSYPSVYTPAGTAAGAFEASTFRYGAGTTGITAIRAYQLPAALKYSVIATAGDSLVIAQSGPQPLTSGDVLWSDAFPFGTMVGLTRPATYFTQTLTNNFSANDILVVGNDTFKFVSALANPGDVLRGADFTTSANSLNNAINRDGPTAGSTYIAPATTRTAFGKVLATTPVTIVVRANAIGTSSTLPTTYTPAGTSAGSFLAATLLPAAEMYNASMTTPQNAIISHPAGSGQLWVMPVGFKRDIQATAMHNLYRNFPIGMEMPCESAFGFNCTVSYDERNISIFGLIGKWTAGNNMGASASVAESGTANALVDLIEAGSVGSSYFNFDFGSSDNQNAPFAVLNLCGAGYKTLMAGSYNNFGNFGACMPTVGLFPPTSGSSMLWLTLQGGQAPIGASVIDAGRQTGPWNFQPTTSVFSATQAFCVNAPSSAVGTAAWAVSTNAGCSPTTSWNMARVTNATWGTDWEYSFYNGGVGMRFGAPSDGYKGHQGPIGNIGIPSGILTYTADDFTNAPANSRVISMATIKPTNSWSLQGEFTHNALATPGSQAGWVYAPTFTTTLTGPVVKGTTTSVGVTACPPVALPTTTLISDTQPTAPATDFNLGFQSSCTANVLTFTAGALNASVGSGDTIQFLQVYPAAKIANDTAGTSWPAASAVAIASLAPCGSTTVGIGTVNNGQTIAAAGYGLAVSTTGSSNRLVFCDGTSWTYH